MAIMEPKLKHWNQRVQVGEAGVPQGRLMDRQGVGAHHVSAGGALLADSSSQQFGPLEVEVQVDEQPLTCSSSKRNFSLRMRMPPGRRPSKMRAIGRPASRARRTAG